MNISSSNFTVKVNGVEVVEIPEDLFIPPDALQVILEQFGRRLGDILTYFVVLANCEKCFPKRCYRLFKNNYFRAKNAQ